MFERHANADANRSFRHPKSNMATVLRDIITHIAHPQQPRQHDSDDGAASTRPRSRSRRHTNSEAQEAKAPNSYHAPSSHDAQYSHPDAHTSADSHSEAQSRQERTHNQQLDSPTAQTTRNAAQTSDYMPNHDGAALTAPSASPSMAPRTAYSSNDLTQYDGNVIKIRDIAHIESLANEFDNAHGLRCTNKYDISGMPIGDVIEMVAGLLTKITTTNDRQHESLHRPLPTQEQSQALTGLSASVLAFHGKNVPSITILSYLTRIHKYCPLTYEVFLSLLVYFDRMTERVNPATLRELARKAGSDKGTVSSGQVIEDEDEPPRTPISLSVSPTMEDVKKQDGVITPPSDDGTSPSPINLHNYFVVDSFNIHRLIIAGITCASKYFSDTFYTNSRYAKVCFQKVEKKQSHYEIYINGQQVGGLPLQELNHLELQFLLLNDFRLAVPVEELDAYGTMLVEFYMRDVVGAEKREVRGDVLQDES